MEPIQANESTQMTSAYDDDPIPNENDVTNSTYTTTDQQQQQQQPPPVPSQQQGQTQAQSDQNAAPPPPTYCQKVFQWFPLRYLSFIGGIAMVTLIFIDFFAPPYSINPLSIAQILYLLVFGAVTMAIEAPSLLRFCYTHFYSVYKYIFFIVGSMCTRRCQLKIFFGARFLSRMWGRALFYFTISIICYRTTSVFYILAGVYIIFMGIFNFIFSILSANKFRVIRTFIAAGSEGDEMVARFERKFDELQQRNAGGKGIGSSEVVFMAEEAGKVLSNAERHSIQTFLDESCNGFITKEDWMKQMHEQYIDDGFKQRFL